MFYKLCGFQMLHYVNLNLQKYAKNLNENHKFEPQSSSKDAPEKSQCCIL